MTMKMAMMMPNVPIPKSSSASARLSALRPIGMKRKGAPSRSASTALLGACSCIIASATLAPIM